MPARAMSRVAHAHGGGTEEGSLVSRPAGLKHALDACVLRAVLRFSVGLCRYQRCYALTRPGGAYRQLMTAEDRSLLPTLAAFQNILQYKRVALPPGALRGQQLYDYYSGLILTYLGEEALFW